MKKSLLFVLLFFAVDLYSESKNIESNSKFNSADIAKAKQSLADIGVDITVVDDNLEILKKFAITQGYQTFYEAMSSLVSGHVKAGRGISNIDIMRIQKYAEQMGNPVAATILFTQMCNTLDYSFNDN
jgi:hypothetical protein